MAKKKSEERTEERKPTRKEKIAYEKELIKEGKILPRYSARSPLGRILLLIFIFFFGLFAAIAGIIGTFAYLGTRPVKESFKLFNFDYNKYLTETAADMSVLDLVQKAGDTSNFNSLGAISEYTPLVDDLLKKVEEQISALGIHIDENELKATSFSEIGNYFSQNVIQNIVLGETLHLTPDSNALLIALCYGQEGVDYQVVTDEGGAKSFQMMEGHEALTLQSVKDSDMSALLDKITVEDALGVNADSDMAIRYLAYGSLGTHYEIRTDGETKTVVMLKDENNEPYPKKTVSWLTAANANILENAKISDIIDTTDADSILGAVKDWTITDMGNSDKFMDLKIGDLLGDVSDKTGIVKTIADKNWTFKQLSEDNVLSTLKISEIIEVNEGDGILGAMKDWTIDDLSNSYRIERMKIAQFITPGDDPLMNKISQWRIGEMGKDKFNSLTLSDVLDLGENPPKLLEMLKEVPLGDCSSAIDNMRLSDILEGDLSGNMILKNLQNCTLATLADDIQKLTVADLFGDDVYTYMRTEKDGTNYTYASAVHAYETEHTVQATSHSVIYDLYIDLNDLNGNADGKVYSVNSDFIVSANGLQVVLGTFENTAEGYLRLADEKKIYAGNTGYYIERELRLTPVYVWKTVDYANKTLAPLPAGDDLSADNEGKTNGSPEGATGTAYMQNGAPVYYISGEKYYAVYEDAYCCYYFNTEGGRVDLDYSLSGYTAPDGTALPLTGGKITYLANEYSVRSKSGAETYDYILQKIAVEQFYYADNGTDAQLYNQNELYTKDQIEERWSLMCTQNGVTTKEADLDRFLDGVWYLLFGGEKRDESGNLVLDDDGNIIIIDKTDTPITKVAGSISGANDVLNNLKLWQLYLHGMINANPYAEFFGQQINELTISQLVQMIAGWGA